MNSFVEFAHNPFFAALRSEHVPNMDGAVYGDHVRTPKPSKYPFALTAAVQGGDARIGAAPSVAANYAGLADLYIFEMNWLTPAVDLYEKAAVLSPEELAYRWRLVDLYLNTPRADKMLSELQYLAERRPGDQLTRDWYQAYKKAYDFGKF